MQNLSSTNNTKNTNRRRFFQRLGQYGWQAGAVVFGAACVLWSLATLRFYVPNTHRVRSLRLKIGTPDRFPAETVDTRFRDSHGVWIVHTAYQGTMQIAALRTTCTHLGCITLWQATERQFKCPCHGSGFRANGINFEGPAPRPLERCAIRIADDGQLEVDPEQIFREELGEWADPASFVETSNT